jgi:hypothetical protein
VDEEIEESIKEDILENSDRLPPRNKSEMPTPIMTKDGNPFSSKGGTNIKMNATPNTILSNK